MAADGEPKWETLEREAVHQGRVRLVDHTIVLGDSSRTRYEVDESIPFAVATLVLDHEQVILTRQHRHPIDRWIHDLPGGAGGEDEAPSSSAKAGRWLVSRTHPIPRSRSGAFACRYANWTPRSRAERSSTLP